ncbi:ferric reductase family protein Ecym_4779 [Eremothecium cymbalariae DBVPG|uniref:FAD-binding FR-type domain-containing protein n=1 Tax=Eremothecium cymbalariae (strain CBS 270.75 / DBVPG 7215 / KCTC 17166 / NRRL Y-17582) TaxID=931890 RepID=G8JSR9_ERECY|nr:hypothetical protein Ecym_4779 [Eremothecium cymbalariae DBVPG\
MIFAYRALPLLFLFTLTYAHIQSFRVSKTKQIMVACQYATNDVFKFESQLTIGPLDQTSMCNNTEYLDYFVDCTKRAIKTQGGSSDEFRKELKKICPLYRDVDSDLSSDLASDSRYPALVESYDVAFNSYHSLVVHVTNKIYFCSIFLAYWGLMLFAGTMTNLFNHLAPTMTLMSKRTVGNTFLVRKYREHISLPALFSKQHTDRTKLGGVIPTRLETLILVIFFILLVILEAVGYVSYPDVVDKSRPALQILNAFGHRAGATVVFLVPLTVLFGTRNNIMMWLTGWKQSTFFKFHKWLARILVVVSVIHAVCMCTSASKRGIFRFLIGAGFARWGLVAVIVIVLLSLQAVSWLRLHYYEVFLAIHMLLAVVFLVGIWKHVDATEELSPFVYATVAVWVFDILCRVGQLVFFGMNDATIQAISGETLQLTVAKRSWWKSFPGAYGYVHLMTPLYFWQSHPFTLVDNGDGSVRFYIKIKEGTTKAIYENVLMSSTEPRSIKVAVEGPHGDHKPMMSYESVLLYTGGNGIPGPYAYIKELCTHKESRTKFVKLYWVIRHWKSIDWFYDELQSLAEYKNVQTIIYVSKYDDANVGSKHILKASSIDSEEDKSSFIDELSTKSQKIISIQNSLRHIEFRKGRPDLATLVSQDLAENPTSDSAIMTCAHPLMCDEIRHRVAQEVGQRKKGRIDLFEELQVW